VTVPLKDGKTATRTLYSTDHGPILTSILGLPIFPWTPERAYAMGDANASNFRYLNHFFETDQAQSVPELDAILKRNQGIPWVNTIAADSAGRAYYADISVVPNVPDSKTAACAVPLGFPPVQIKGIHYVDGGLLGSLPLWAAEELGATRAIAVNCLTSLPFRLLRTVLRPRKPTPYLDIFRIEPSVNLGSLRDAIVWDAANVEKWITLGEQDANRALTSGKM